MEPHPQRPPLGAIRPRPDVAAARQRRQADQPGFDPARLVFIDETGNATNMARRHGRITAPFVMNTREEIHQAIRDYQAGRF